MPNNGLPIAGWFGKIPSLGDFEEEAELKAAVQELRGIGAIEVYGNVGYKFTARGFEMAARLTQIT